MKDADKARVRRYRRASLAIRRFPTPNIEPGPRFLVLQTRNNQQETLSAPIPESIPDEILYGIVKALRTGFPPKLGNRRSKIRQAFADALPSDEVKP